MKFGIDIKIFLVLIFFLFKNQMTEYIIVMICMLLHEIGHILAGIIMKMKPNKICLIPLGLSVNFNINPKDINIKIKKGNLLEVKKIFVAISGPVVNVLIIMILNILKLQSEMIECIIYSNILLIFFNLLPIYPLDGARILRGILHIYFGKRKSIHIIRDISIISLVIFTAFVSVLILYLKNISCIFIVVILWLIFLKEEKIFKTKETIYKAIDDLKMEEKNILK